MSDSPPIDDPSITDDQALWRRIHPEQVVFDNNLNRQRPTSQAFNNTSGTSGMSVDIADETTIQDALKGYSEHLLVEFEAGLARQLNQGVIRDPFPGNPAHAEVMGKKRKPVQKGLYTKCRWVVGPN
jgi:hypothetical protein